MSGYFWLFEDDFDGGILKKRERVYNCPMERLFCVAPEFFQIVERTSFFVENMNNNIDKIQEHPGRFAVSFVVPDFFSGPFRSVAYFFGDGPDLGVRICRADDEEIRHRCQLSQIEDNDIVRFFRESKRSNFLSERF